MPSEWKAVMSLLACKAHPFRTCPNLKFRIIFIIIVYFARVLHHNCLLGSCCLWKLQMVVVIFWKSVDLSMASSGTLHPNLYPCSCFLFSVSDFLLKWAVKSTIWLTRVTEMWCGEGNGQVRIWMPSRHYTADNLITAINLIGDSNM